MSVIVAKSSVCCSTSAAVTYDCFPAVSVQRIIPQGQTLIVDGLATSNFLAGHWMVYVINQDASRARVFQVFATHQNGTGPTFNVYATIGDLILIDPNVTSSGGVMSISFANSDTEDLLVCVTRMAVPVDNTQANALDIVEIGSARSYVANGSTNQLDFISLDSGIVAANWMVTLTDSTGLRTSSQIYAVLDVDLPVFIEYGKTGDTSLAHDIVITQVAGMGFEVAISNTGTTPYRVSLTRIPIQLSTGISTCDTNSRGLSLWIPTSTVIAATSSGQVDTISFPQHASARWLMTIRDLVSSKTMAVEVVATNTQSGASVVTYGYLGPFLNVVASVSVPGDLILSLTNNRANPVTVNLLRAPTAS